MSGDLSALRPPAIAAPDLDSLPEVPSVTLPDLRAFADIVAAERPIILKGLVEHWPALAAGRQSAEAMATYLKAMDQGVSAPVMEAPARTGGWFFYSPDLREFNFSKRQRGVSETIDYMLSLAGDADAPFVAIQMLPLLTSLPRFVVENPMPLLPREVMPRLWLGGPVRSQTHNDRDHNLACVIAGRRRFLLFPPEEVGNLYVGPLDNPPPLSFVNPEAPDLERFPRFARAMTKAVVAHLEAGDCLFLPKYWWHHVTSLDKFNVMVNYWWGDTATGLERADDCFQTALLALKDLPPGERAYWKAMFDAYVFRTADDATSHIPEVLRGALGPMNRERRAALKRQLRTAYMAGEGGNP